MIIREESFRYGEVRRIIVVQTSNNTGRVTFETTSDSVTLSFFTNRWKETLIETLEKTIESLKRDFPKEDL